MKEVTKILDFISMKAFAVILLFNNSMQSTLFEGETCSLKDKRFAKCTKLQECTSVVEKLKTKQITYDSLETCSFISNTAIICCEDHIIKSEPSDVTHSITTKIPGEIVFMDDNIKIFKFTSDTTTVTNLIDSRNEASNVGRKAAADLKAWTYALKSIGCDVSIMSLMNAAIFVVKLVAHLKVAIGFGIITSGSVVYSFDCGGSLISDRYILTAAHCLNEVDKTLLKILIGTVDITNNDYEGVELTAEEILQHPKYKTSRTYNDVGLIRLNQTVTFDYRKRPACLGTELADMNENVRLIVSGWGVMNTTTRTKTPVLLYTNLTSVDLQTCNITHRTLLGRVLSYDEGLNEGQMCAFDKDLKQDACVGDSGGPLQYKFNEKSFMYTVVGITSFGHGCATGIPSVYARVAYYLEWIENIVWN